MAKGLIAAVLIIFGVIIVVGLLSTQAWNPGWNPFTALPPSDALEQSLEQLFSQRTLAFEGTIGIVGNRPGNEFDLSVNFLGEVDKQDKKSYVSFAAQLKSEGTEFSVGGEVKGFGDEVYLKLSSLPAFLSLLSPQLASLQGQWIKIDKELVQEVTGQQAALEEEQDKERAEALKKELIDLFKGRVLFKVKRKLADEKVAEQLAFHYLVSLNKQEIKELIVEGMQVVASSSKEMAGENIEEEVAKFLQVFPEQFDESFRQIGEIELEIWLSQTSNLPLQIKLVKEIDLAKIELPADIEQQLEGKVNIALDLIFSKFGEQIEIEVPDEFILMQELFGSFSPEPQESLR